MRSSMSPAPVPSVGSRTPVAAAPPANAVGCSPMVSTRSPLNSHSPGPTPIARNSFHSNSPSITVRRCQSWRPPTVPRNLSQQFAASLNPAPSWTAVNAHRAGSCSPTLTARSVKSASGHAIDNHVQQGALLRCPSDASAGGGSGSVIVAAPVPRGSAVFGVPAAVVADDPFQRRPSFQKSPSFEAMLTTGSGGSVSFNADGAVRPGLQPPQRKPASFSGVGHRASCRSPSASPGHRSLSRATLPAPLPLQRVLSYDGSAVKWNPEGSESARGPGKGPVPQAFSVLGGAAAVPQPSPSAVPTANQAPAVVAVPTASSFGGASAGSFSRPTNTSRNIEDPDDDEYSQPSDDLQGLLAHLDTLKAEGMKFTEVTYLVNDFTYWGIPMKHHGFVLRATDPSFKIAEYLSLDFSRRGILWDTFDNDPDAPEGTTSVSRHLINIDPLLVQTYCKETQPFSWPSNDCASWSRGLLKVLRVKESNVDGAIGNRLPTALMPSKGYHPMDFITCGGSRVSSRSINRCF